METRVPKTKTSHRLRRFHGGEGGIRTREPLWVTRFPSVRAKPDYATSPYFMTAKLYHSKNLIIQRTLIYPIDNQKGDQDFRVDYFHVLAPRIRIK